MDFFINAAVLGLGPMTSNTMKMGGLTSFGFMPEAGVSFSGIGGANYTGVTGKGGTFSTFDMSGFGHETTYTSGTMQKFGKTRSFLSKGAGRVAGSMFSSAIPLAFSSYFIYKGYQENGLAGASDAAIYDLATGTGLMANREAFMISKKFARADIASMTDAEKKIFQAAGKTEADLAKGQKAYFTGTRMSMGKFIGKSVGAGFGAAIGQELAGTPGAFVGAFAGASMNPYVALGTAAIVGMAAVGTQMIVNRGATILKKGAEKRAMRRKIDTAGDTAAFFTRNANTMRSRAVLSMRNSHLNARSALGMEASFTHMRKNYF